MDKKAKGYFNCYHLPIHLEPPDCCQSCDYKEPAQGGWCYMFETMPKDKCMQWREIIRGIGKRVYTTVSDWRKGK